ncbi:hypothetical protein CEXT_318311 [Caerostris extrusa]|uniref:Transmembrane protein n=1 Tax=Caerostris extrusa TaxID=172846 RepID=A0AAV4MYQ4_CAEEX|nr:hypothetical protein CEXT_318311 [Caerostris extrusa]
MRAVSSGYIRFSLPQITLVSPTTPVFFPLLPDLSREKCEDGISGAAPERRAENNDRGMSSLAFGVCCVRSFPFFFSFLVVSLFSLMAMFSFAAAAASSLRAGFPFPSAGFFLLSAALGPFFFFCVMKLGSVEKLE